MAKSLIGDLGRVSLAFLSDVESGDIFRFSLIEGRVYSVDELKSRGIFIPEGENYVDSNGKKRFLLEQGKLRGYLAKPIYQARDLSLELNGAGTLHAFHINKGPFPLIG